MIGTGGITGRRPDATIFFRHQLLVGQILVRRVPRAARFAVDDFRQTFRQPISERFGHDRVVIVVVAFEARHELRHSNPRGDREGANVIGDAAALGRHEVGESLIFARGGLLLLSQRVHSSDHIPAHLVGIQLDIVAGGIRGPESEGSSCDKQTLADDFVEKLAGVIVELFCARLLKNVRIASAELPGLEERRPIDQGLDAIERKVVVGPCAEERRACGRAIVQDRLAASRLVDGEQRNITCLLRFAQLLEIAARGLYKCVALLRQERADDTDAARGIEHMYGC